MEILLLEDVNGIGKKNDLLVVGDGFALNCLLPQRKALVATPTVRKRYADQIKKRAVEKDQERQVQQNIAGALAGKTLVFIRKAAKGGKLYASVTEKDISTALKEQLSIDTISADDVRMTEHLKTTGNTQIQVKVGDQLFPVSVSVQAEQPKVVATKKAEEKPEEKEA